MSNNQSHLVRVSLERLSVGEAFGQQFFYPGVVVAADPSRSPAPLEALKWQAVASPGLPT
ncbi:hypothetical protein [Rubinisphaera margarita]|uniref:hypothetical protein n=1 Tax=Rubinisphaera margarita TaxID=2909586 RepID=UPI001EE7C1D2|nr:hypothetical protein [Rubinisphaera margarita]MCG6156630.1 hypothetical protein [Rubinisphaera margarita]